MSLSTGTSATGTVYRYYSCSKSQKVANDCPGLTLREDFLDGLVVNHLADFLFEPQRLSAVLREAIESARAAQVKAPKELKGLLRRKSDLDGRFARVRQAIDLGTFKFDPPALMERLQGLGEEAGTA